MKTLTLIVGESHAAMWAETESRFGGRLSMEGKYVSATAGRHLMHDAHQRNWSPAANWVPDGPAVLLHPWATLHPRHQVEEFACFIERASQTKVKEVVVLTCHDTIVNAVGEDMECDTVGLFSPYLSPDERWDALVVLVRDTGVTEHRYDKRGVLGDGWPVGFFCP